jgi:hypothetical protein
MKRVEANRYPNSAALFRFCKEALATKSKTKVIDQEVGAILGFDPADCSHWKKGKKNVKSFSTIKTIADHLNADERLLIDVASGSIEIDEAIYEYKGYGLFHIPSKVLDELKKEFFKTPNRWQNQNEPRTFEELFDVNRPKISRLAEDLIELGQFKEAPLYVPEIFQMFSEVKIEHQAELDSVIEVKNENGMYSFLFKDATIRPFTRFLLFKELYNHIIAPKNNLGSSPDVVREVQANIFASSLIIPAKLLKVEIQKIDANFDLITQLAERFWVSKHIMNQRLRDYLQYGL